MVAIEDNEFAVSGSGCGGSQIIKNSKICQKPKNFLSLKSWPKVIKTLPNLNKPEVN